MDTHCTAGTLLIYNDVSRHTQVITIVKFGQSTLTVTSSEDQFTSHHKQLLVIKVVVSNLYFGY